MRVSPSLCRDFFAVFFKFSSRVLPLLIICGCSKLWTPSGPNGASATANVNDDQLFTSQAPLEVKVSQTFYDRDGKLHMKVLLKPRVELPTADLAVTLVGLKDGVQKIEETKRVAEVYSEPTVAADSLIAVQFEFNPPDVSEFQIRASWGDEGREAAAKASVALGTAQPPKKEVTTSPIQMPEEGAPLAETASAGTLVLRQLRVEERKVSCDDGCDRELTVVVELSNESSSPIHGATLGVKLAWVNAGESGPEIAVGSLSPDEEAVSLETLSLAPGQKRQVRVAIDRVIPEVAGGAFVPLVRLVGGSA